MANLILNVVSIKDGPSIENVETSCPTTYDALCAWLPGGADAVLANALANLTVAAQAAARGKLGAKNKDGSREFTDGQIRAFMKDEWKPGEGRKQMSDLDRLQMIRKHLVKAGMSTAEVDQKIAALQAPAVAEKPKPALVKGKGRKAA